MKNTISSKNIDNWTGLPVPLGLKLSGHTHTLIKASNLLDEKWNEDDFQSEQQYRYLLEELHNIQLNYRVTFYNKRFSLLDLKMKLLYWLLWINLHKKKLYLNNYKISKNNLKWQSLL